MDDFTGYITATLIGIAAIVGAFARPLFQHIFTGRAKSCLVTETAVEHLRELHSWHGPDQNGQQSWKGHGVDRELQKLTAVQKEMNDSLRELVVIARRSWK